MRRVLLALLPLLAGCGSYLSVKVPYDVPELPAAAAARPALAGLYVTVRTDPPPDENLLGALAALALKNSPVEFRADELARRAARAVNRGAARTCAWRVDRPGTGDAFPRALTAAGSLELAPAAPAVSAKQEERTFYYYDKDKKKQTAKSKVWAYSASLFAEVKLYSLPGRELLDSWADTFTYAEDRADNSTDPADWYADSEEKLFSALTARLTARYAGRRVERFRPVFRIKKDAASEEAARLASRGDWDKAEAVWRARLPAADWRDSLGLAVAAELRKDYSAAAGYYREAQRLAAGRKEAAPVRWEEIFRDLELASSSAPASGCGTAWFGVRTALLPFTDETTSVDGPPLVRQLLYERLKAAGYDLMPLEKTDEALRAHGFSDGGQLAAAKPSDIASWLGAGRLVYCNITDFSEVMAGVYSRRMVKGSARVWDAATGAETVFEESVVKVKTPKNFVAGMFGQLAKGLAERIKNKPLAYESGLFSGQLAGNLPNRP